MALYPRLPVHVLLRLGEGGWRNPRDPRGFRHPRPPCFGLRGRAGGSGGQPPVATAEEGQRLAGLVPGVDGPADARPVVPRDLHSYDSTLEPTKLTVIPVALLPEIARGSAGSSAHLGAAISVILWRSGDIAFSPLSLIDPASSRTPWNGLIWARSVSHTFPGAGTRCHRRHRTIWRAAVVTTSQTRRGGLRPGRPGSPLGTVRLEPLPEAGRHRGGQGSLLAAISCPPGAPRAARGSAGHGRPGRRRVLRRPRTQQSRTH